MSQGTRGLGGPEKGPFGHVPPYAAPVARALIERKSYSERGLPSPRLVFQQPANITALSMGKAMVPEPSCRSSSTILSRCTAIAEFHDASSAGSTQKFFYCAVFPTSESCGPA